MLKGSKTWLVKSAALAIGLSGLMVVAPTATAQTTTGNYVALGDSFSSGPGSGIFPGQLTEDTSVYGDTLDKCNRSSKAYPVKLAAARGLSLTNVSCGGATVENVMSTGQFGEPAQIDAITANTDLVTLTIGGNDVGFVDIIPCVVTSTCTASSPAIVAANAAVNALEPKVQQLLTTVKSKAPNAKVILAGYPRLLSSSGNFGFGCVPWLTNGEQALIAVLQTRVNNVLSRAATASGVNFIDPMKAGSPFEKHDAVGAGMSACSLSAIRMINGVRLDFGAGAFHPNRYGQEGYFTLFNAVA